MASGVGRLFVLSWCLLCYWPAINAYSNLKTVWQSKELEFVFPSDAAKARAIQNKYYVVGNSVPIDVDKYYSQDGSKNRLFITIPRFGDGRPATLAYVRDDGRLAPYPDYSWNDNQGKNCSGLTSVFRTVIDKCNRLWVMDAGKIGEQQVCPPQLLVFDLRTDQLIYRYIVDKTKYTDASLFVTPVVDDCGIRDCSAPFVYVADVTGFTILVIDVANDRSWVVKHRLLFPYPSSGTFTINGESFDLMDGVFGMALSPCRPGCDRTLFFHALASNTENMVNTSVLKNDAFIKDSNANPSAIKVFPDTRLSQSAAEAMDKDGNMFSVLMEPPCLYAWNIHTKVSNFCPITINRDILQFASGVKIINNPNGKQELYILTNSFQQVMTGTISASNYNFRILAENVTYLLNQSRC